MNIANIESKYGGREQTPERIIIHAMGEYIDNGEQDYHAKDWLDFLTLSVHYMVCPSGVIIQTRPIDQMAWHARGHNTGSVGIEFLVSGVHTYETLIEAIKTEYITEPQFNAGVELCNHLRASGIKEITRHDWLSPDRKFDPGAGFPWENFIEALRP